MEDDQDRASGHCGILGAPPQKMTIIHPRAVATHAETSRRRNSSGTATVVAFKFVGILLRTRIHARHQPTRLVKRLPSTAAAAKVFLRALSETVAAAPLSRSAVSGATRIAIAITAPRLTISKSDTDILQCRRPLITAASAGRATTAPPEYSCIHWPKQCLNVRLPPRNQPQEKHPGLPRSRIPAAPMKMLIANFSDAWARAVEL